MCKKITPMRTWLGSVDKCDFCEAKIVNLFVDGRIKSVGVWGILCPVCFIAHGSGLGTGKGQMYKLRKIGGQKYWIDSRDLVGTVITNKYV